MNRDRDRDALWRFAKARAGNALALEARLDLPTLQPTSVAGGWDYHTIYHDLEVEARKRIISQLYHELWADVLEAGLYGPPKDKTS